MKKKLFYIHTFFVNKFNSIYQQPANFLLSVTKKQKKIEWNSKEFGKEIREGMKREGFQTELFNIPFRDSRLVMLS